ncbi:MAG: glycosyltransferase family 2 protein [Chlamydiales bacterium]|nr:glycosyltransferase family 2 protein [Chlamydiales bacterium]
MISVTIIVKNGQRYLPQVLKALETFSEIIVLDTGSTDDTITIAKSFPNVALHQSPFLGFGPSHNLATSLASNDWVLSIDADEVASPELIKEIFALQLEPNTIYTISRHNYFRGKFIKGCGWYPDCPVRLYNRKVTAFTDAKVHESILDTNMKKQALKSPLYHYPYNSISDFLAKMQSYSTLFAEQYKGKRKSSLTKAITHGLFAFFKSYFIKRGIFLGSEGFIISLYNGHTAYYKYLKLQEISER